MSKSFKEQVIDIINVEAGRHQGFDVNATISRIQALEEPLTCLELKTYLDTKPYLCEGLGSCDGCSRLFWCNSVVDCEDWDIPKMTKIVRGVK